MSIEDHIWTLVAKRLANEATEEELLELDQLLKQYADTNKQVKIIADWWYEDNPQEVALRGSALFEKIKEKISTKENEPAASKRKPPDALIRRKKSVAIYLVNNINLVGAFFKVAWRNAKSNVAYSLINVVGLAAGMAVALLIGLWVNYQLSFDKYLPGYDHLYQVRQNFNSGGEILTDNAGSLKLAEVLQRRIPEIERVTAIHFDKHGLKNGNHKIFMDGAIVDTNFFKVMRFKLIHGNAANAFRDPYSILLGESAAKALFGDADPVGKVVNLDNRNDVKVAGVVQDVPENSSFKFSFLIPMAYTDITEGWIKNAREGGFDGNDFILIAALNPGANYGQVANKIKDIQKESVNKKYAQVIMQSIFRLHLHSDYVNGRESGGMISYVRLFSIIGVLVLAIACINFVNLTTARSQKRAREVGVRKAIGSRRGQLITQFLTESFMFTGVAFILCLVFMQMMLPYFNALTGTSVAIPFASVKFWFVAAAFIFLTAIAAGSRPAFYLSSFNPVDVLKGNLVSGFSSGLSRKILVVTQFACSISLIISTIVIYRQIQYAKNRPTGYNVDRLVVTDFNTDLHTNYIALKNELLQSGLVQSITNSANAATEHYGTGTLDSWPGKQPGETAQVAYIGISEDYFKTLGIGISEGTGFNSLADTSSIILNEAAVARLRLKDPLSQDFVFGKQHIRVKAVVKNALMGSVFSSVDPTVYYYNPKWWTFMIYRLSATVDMHTAMEKVTRIFNKYAPAFPYTYHFADEDYNKKFEMEALVGKLSGLFASLAIFISCLGLFGLAAYMAEQRTKEIGIRKVLGASVFNLWQLISREFVVLVVISLFVAIPSAWYIMNKWLQGYQYHTTLSWWIFGITAVSAIMIALCTVSFQGIRAALANPVKSLRSE